MQAVAVCFLHAWCNPAHERAVADAARRRLPDAFVTTSSEVLPQIKEFERFSTTVANAVVGPVIDAYLERLQARLRETGFAGPLFVILSHGGVASAEEASRLAAGTALSGPAGGVAAAVALSRAGIGNDLITFDMGGTSTDIALVRDGGADVVRRPVRGRCADRAAEARHRHAGRGRRFDRASGPLGPAAGRAGERRGRSRAGLLRPRRHAADGHGRQSRARLSRPGGCSAGVCALDRAAAERAVERLGAGTRARP